MPAIRAGIDILGTPRSVFAALDGAVTDLDAVWRPQPRRFERPLVTALTVASGAYLLAAVLCLLLIDAPGRASSWEAGLLCLAYLLATQVRFEFGASWVLGTQVTLVPLLLLLPPGQVPAIVGAVMLMGALVGVLRGDLPADRLLSALASSWHVVGPVLVLAAVGVPEPGVGQWPVYLLMFASQIGTEAIADTVISHWDPQEGPWRRNLRGLWLSQIVDGLLFPVGLLAAVAAMTTGEVAWALLTVPVVLLLGVADWERRRRVRQSRARLDALERVRERSDAVLARVGAAMGTLHDPAALVELAAVSAREGLNATLATVPDAPGHAPPDADADLVDALRRRAVHENGGVAMQEGERAGVAAPVVGLAMPTALVCVRHGAPFSPAERQWLLTLAGQLSAGLRAADAHRRLRHQAETDHLTGLWNHRRFHEHLAALLGAGDAVGLVLIDLDDFKAVNDTHGHQVGDRVLAAVGRLLSERCRDQDRPARYGGEEFAVVLAGATPDDARAVAERLRAEIAELRVFAGPGARVGVSASVGVALTGEEPVTAAALIAEADAALYEAKRAGKDRVVLASAVTR